MKLTLDLSGHVANVSVGDHDHVMADDTTAITLTEVFTAPRVLTLPPANKVAPGRPILIVDMVGAVGGRNYLKIETRGEPAFITRPHHTCLALSDGVGAWAVSVLPSANMLQRFPAVHPSSGNAQGAGFSVKGQILTTDQNPHIEADAFYWTCVDPSALATFPIGGTWAVGDTVTLTFRVGGGSYPATHIVVDGGTSPASVALGLRNAIRSNHDLYQQPDPPINILGGGIGKPILFSDVQGDLLAVDTDFRENVTVSCTISGAGTVELPAVHPIPLPKRLDANALFLRARHIAGHLIPDGSNVANDVFAGNRSDNVNDICQQYVSLAATAVRTQAGDIKGSYLIGTPNRQGHIAHGLYVSDGIYGPGVPGSDKGPDTANFAAYFKNGRDIHDRAHARYRVASDYIPPNGFSVIPFGVAVDAAANYDVANYAYTAQHDSRHVVTAKVDVVVGSTNAHMAIALFVNGVNVEQRTFQRGPSANETFEATFSRQFSEGDVITVRIYTSAPITVVGSAAEQMSYIDIQEAA